MIFLSFFLSVLDSNLFPQHMGLVSLWIGAFYLLIVEPVGFSYLKSVTQQHLGLLSVHSKSAHSARTDQLPKLHLSC